MNLRFERLHIRQESIRRRKKAFEDRTKEIEAQLAAEADRERRWLESDPQEAAHASSDDRASSSAVADSMKANLVAKNSNRRTSHVANDIDIGEVHQHDQKYNQNHGKCCSIILLLNSCQHAKHRLERFKILLLFLIGPILTQYVYT